MSNKVSRVKENDYYIYESVGWYTYQLVQVTSVTSQSVEFKVVGTTMSTPYPFLLGTTHEITTGTFLSIFTSLPRLKGMFLDEVNNE